MKPGSKEQDNEHEQLKTAVIAFLDVLGHPLLAGEHMPTTVAGLAASARGAYCSHCGGVGSIFPFPGDGSDGIPVDERVCPVCHGVRTIGAMSVCGFEPTEKEDEMKLGSRVRDSITGFAGIAVSRTEYLFGCVLIGVQPAGMTEKGKPEELEYFDEQRLSAASTAKSGGPGVHPPQRSTPPSR